MTREGAEWATDRVARHGAQAGSPEAVGWGFAANEHAPVLRTHDNLGHRIDEVHFHPAWHALMSWSVRSGVHSLPHTNSRPGAWVARSAMFMLSAAVDAGHCCPVSMTTACVSALRSTPELAAEWVPRVTSTDYDERFLPADQKRGCLVGMAMTEKQGGSDLRTNSCRAESIGAGGPGQPYMLTGDKWFVSAPMCDAFLTLAQTTRGVSCFLLPRFLPDGRRNALHIDQLKDKLGNRSNATAEVQYRGALAFLVGEEGRGIPLILHMVNHTRLDVALVSTALMRQAVAHAIHYARHRITFNRRLSEHELMQNVLADLSLESEAATVLSMRLAGAFDRERTSEWERLFRRIALPFTKYWICKRAPSHVCEAMECMGGNGFIETFIHPRLYREAPLNSIWEGSGNVICMDVLRVLERAPEAADVLLGELRMASGASRQLDAEIRSLAEELHAPSRNIAHARRLTERLALALQAALLVRSAPAPVAAAFIASRVGGSAGVCFGTLPSGTPCQAVIERALPEEPPASARLTSPPP